MTNTIEDLEEILSLPLASLSNVIIKERVRALIAENKELLIQREREHQLIHDMKDEISKLKQTVNNLRQKLHKQGDDNG